MDFWDEFERGVVLEYEILSEFTLVIGTETISHDTGRHD